MKPYRLFSVFSIGMMFLLAVSGFSQKKFIDANVDYTFMLPNDDWKMTVKPSKMSPNVEYVYKFRNGGLLQVRKIKIKSGLPLSRIIRSEEQNLQFKPGFIAGKEENFGGALTGKVFNYEFVNRGRNISGRAYFLKFSEEIIYLVRFTGPKDRLRLIRNQTDSIARTFRRK